MAGRVQWEAQVDSNIKQLLGETKQLRDELDGIKKGNYEIKLNIDEKKLENVISNLDKMLTSLGKGTGDFKEFENLSKQLKEIVSEVQTLNKAFGNINDSGVSELLSSIKNIDKSLSSLSEHIVGVNKDFSGIGKNASDNVGQINEARKATEGLTEATRELANAQNNIGNKSNISSENPIVESQNKIQEELKQTQEQAEKSLLSIKELYNVLKQDIGSTNDREKFAIGNSSTGLFSMPNLGTDYDFISEDLIYSAIEKSKEQIDSLIHTHSEKIAAFSPDDIYTAIEEMEKGIIHQYVKGMDEVTHIDFSQLSKKQWTLVARDFEERFEKLVDTDGWYEDEDVSQEIQDNFQKKMKQILESLIAFYLPKDKSLTDVINTQQIENTTSPIEEYTSPGNSYVIENQNKIQEELKQTQEQAEQTAKAVQNASETQIKDVFQGDKIEQATTSAKELDKTLEKVDIPTDSFDDVLFKLDLTESKLKEIVKITKQSVSDSEGKFHDSYTLKDKRGSTEIYGLSSNTEKGQLLRSNIVGYDAKEIEQETKAVQKLAEEKRKLRQQEKQSTQSSVDKALKDQVSAWKQIQSIREKIAKTDNADEINALQESKKYYQEQYNNANKILKANDDLYDKESQIARLEQIRLETNAKIAGYKKDISLSSMDSELKAFNNQIPKKPADGQRSDKFEGFIQNYKNAIAEAKKYLDTLGDSPVTEEVKKEWERLIDVIKEAKEEMDAVPNAARGSDALSRGKEIDTITKYLDKFTGISKQAKRELNGLLDQLQSGDPSVNVKKIHERFLELTVAERNAGREARNLFDIFKDKKIYSFLGQAASMFSFYDLVNVGREIVANVKDIDTALTELRKVSDATEQRLTTNFKNSADTAKELGATISDVISATADWSRMGYNIDQAEELARVSTLYKNVGDGIDIETANNSLISTLQGFQLDASEAESIIDKFNEVANNYAIDSAGIGEALQRSAASFNAANTDLSKSIALITATRLKKLVEYMETYIKNIFNCHRSLYYYTPQYRGNYYMMV